MKQKWRKRTSSVRDRRLTGFIILVISFVLVFGMSLASTFPASSETEIEAMTSSEITLDDNQDIRINNVETSDTEQLSFEDQQYVNVVDFGAVGDGVTDDHQAIMDAIDYTIENNQDGVYFPSGTFAIGSTIWLNSEYSGLTMISENGIIKVIDESVYRAIEVKADSQGDVEDITIKGLTLDGNKDNLNVDRWGNWGIHVWSEDSTARRIHIENIHAYDFSGNGFYIDTTDTTVKNILSHHNWGHGLAIGGSAQNVTVENITVHDNVSPNNHLYGAGIDIRGGDDIVVNNFTSKNNGFGMKTSIYEPNAIITNGYVAENNWYGIRIIQEPKQIYMDNVTTERNGYSGFVFRDNGEIEIGSISSINDGQADSSQGALYIADEMGEIRIENLTIENYPGDGIYSYTRSVAIEHLDISGCSGVPIYPATGEIVLKPSAIDNSNYTIDQVFELEPLEVHSDGVVLNNEKFRAIPENGAIDVNLDDWTVSDRKFTASASGTVVFEMENLEPYSSYCLYSDGNSLKYASTDSQGYLQFEQDNWSSHVFSVQSGGVNVVTREPTNISSNSVVFQGEVTDISDQSELNAFFRYREVGEVNWQKTKNQTITSLTEYDEKVTGLSPGRSYEYKAVAQWEDSENTGELVSFTTDFETNSYDWQGFLDPQDDDVLSRDTYPVNLLTTVDSVPDSEENENGTTLGYWGEFYIDGQFDGQKQLNSEPETTDYTFENLDKGTYDLKVEWHYDLGLIEVDEITVTIKEGESSFELSNLQVNPREMYVDNDISIKIDVENTGSQSGNYTAEFYKENDKIGSDMVTLDPGQTKTASINHYVNESGTFNISVENQTEEIIVYDRPYVETYSATNITTDSANLHGEAFDISMEHNISTYFRYRKTGNLTWMETSKKIVITEEKFDQVIDGLDSDTEYELKAVIEWDGEEDVGDTLTFTTKKAIPKIETVKTKNVTCSSATLVGEITDMGDYDVVEVFFRLREKGQNDWIESDGRQLVTDKGEFEEIWSNLAPSTTYEFKSVITYNSTLNSTINTFTEDEMKFMETDSGEEINELESNTTNDSQDESDEDDTETNEMKTFITKSSTENEGMESENQDGNYNSYLLYSGLGLIIAIGGVALFMIVTNFKSKFNDQTEEEVEEDQENI